MEERKSRKGQHKGKARSVNPDGFHGTDRLYRIYISMVVRCNRPEHPTYKHYGARGIKVCDEWLKDNLSFYRWATWITQNNNLRTNRYLEARGERHTLAQWSRISGLMPRTIANRIRNGWSVEDSIFVPLRGKR